MVSALMAVKPLFGGAAEVLMMVFIDFASYEVKTGVCRSIMITSATQACVRRNQRRRCDQTDP